MSARQRTVRGKGKKKRREPAARVFSIIIRQSICVRMDCALRGVAAEGGRTGGRGEGVERERPRAGRRGIKGETGAGGERRGAGEGRRDCGVAGVVSESRVQPSGSYEYII